MANTDKIADMDACAAGKAFVGGCESYQVAWDTCEDPGWMLWALYHSPAGTEEAFASIYADVLVHFSEHAGPLGGVLPAPRALDGRSL